MSETPSEPNVNISAQARQHPAIRKLARACIALATTQPIGDHTNTVDLPSSPLPQVTPEGPERQDD